MGYQRTTRHKCVGVKAGVEPGLKDMRSRDIDIKEVIDRIEAKDLAGAYESRYKCTVRQVNPEEARRYGIDLSKIEKQVFKQVKETREVLKENNMPEIIEPKAGLTCEPRTEPKTLPESCEQKSLPELILEDLPFGLAEQIRMAKLSKHEYREFCELLGDWESLTIKDLREAVKIGLEEIVSTRFYVSETYGNHQGALGRTFTIKPPEAMEQAIDRLCKTYGISGSECLRGLIGYALDVHDKHGRII